MKVFNESGKGYWMEGFGCIRAEGENRPSRPGHVIVLNDQGGASLNVSEGVSGCLRAQEHGHQPVVCYPINLMVATRGGKDDMRTCFGIGKPNDPQFTLSSAHEHAVCYEVEK